MSNSQAAAPYAIVMSIILYFICIKLLPPEIDEVENGDETVRQAMAELGPITTKEKKLLLISFIMLGFWITEKVLHSVSTTASTCIAITLMFLPGIEIMNWKDAQAKISWGPLVLFGIGISLGSALLKTGAAKWMANWLVTAFGTETFSSKQCMKVGIPITIVGYIILLLFAQTYWRFIGIM